MVVFVLYVKVDLDGVTSLSLVPGANLCLSVRNPLSESEVREKVVIDPTELEEPQVPAHEKHRAEAASHLSIKWDGEQMRSTCRVLGDSELAAKLSGTNRIHKKGSRKKDEEDDGGSAEKREIRGEDSGKFIPMLAFDCNGLEPYAFHPIGGEFVVTNKAGVKSEIDLSGGDWSAYDLSSGSTSVTNFEAKFE